MFFSPSSDLLIFSVFVLSFLFSKVASFSFLFPWRSLFSLPLPSSLSSASLLPVSSFNFYATRFFLVPSAPTKFLCFKKIHKSNHQKALQAFQNTVLSIITRTPSQSKLKLLNKEFGLSEAQTINNHPYINLKQTQNKE